MVITNTVKGRIKIFEAKKNIHNPTEKLLIRKEHKIILGAWKKKWSVRSVGAVGFLYPRYPMGISRAAILPGTFYLLYFPQLPYPFESAGRFGYFQILEKILKRDRRRSESTEEYNSAFRDDSQRVEDFASLASHPREQPLEGVGFVGTSPLEP